VPKAQHAFEISGPTIWCFISDDVKLLFALSLTIPVMMMTMLMMTTMLVVVVVVVVVYEAARSWKTQSIAWFST
jgi:hypothetical protein